MKIYNKSTSFSRFGCYFIDLFVLGLFTVGIATIVLYAIGFNYNAYFGARNEFFTDYLLYLEYGGQYEKSYLAALNEYFKYSVQFYLVFDSVALVTFFCYLVLLPHFWSKQTIGRMAMGLKVINHTGDIDVSFKKRIVREIIGTWFIYLVLVPITGGLVIVISGIVAIISGRSFIDRLSFTDLVYINPIEIDKESYESAFRFDREESAQFRAEEFKPKKNDAIDAEVKDSDSKDNDDSNETDSDDEYQIF